MRYFTIEELCRSDAATLRGIDNSPSDEAVTSLGALIENVLDPAREEFGGAVMVSSGYRCAKLNRAVGGVATSQHLRGEAADLTTGSREGNRRLFGIIERQGRFDQLIDEHDFSWIHVSYRAQWANRRRVFRLGLVVALLMMIGCSKVNYLPVTRIERVVDTITKTVPDSAMLRALFACDSVGQVYIKELVEFKGAQSEQVASFEGGELRVETRWRTQYIDRLREIHDTTTIVRQVDVVREVRHIPQFFWWTFAVALTAVAYLIARLFSRR